MADEDTPVRRALLAKLEAQLLGVLTAGGRAPRARRAPAAGGPAPRCLRARAGAILRDEARVTVAPETLTSDASCEMPAVDAETPAVYAVMARADADERGWDSLEDHQLLGGRLANLHSVTPASANLPFMSILALT